MPITAQPLALAKISVPALANADNRVALPVTGAANLLLPSLLSASKVTLVPVGPAGPPGSDANVAAHVAEADPHAQYALETAVRERLTANRTYYVSIGGSDGNDGMTAGTAFATLQKAWNTIAPFDLGGYAVTISVAPGTYVGVSSPTAAPQHGTVVIESSTGVASDAVVTVKTVGAYASCFYLGSLVNLTLCLSALTLDVTSNLTGGIYISRSSAGVLMLGAKLVDSVFTQAAMRYIGTPPASGSRALLWAQNVGGVQVYGTHTYAFTSSIWGIWRIEQYSNAVISGTHVAESALAMQSSGAFIYASAFCNVSASSVTSFTGTFSGRLALVSLMSYYRGASTLLVGTVDDYVAAGSFNHAYAEPTPHDFEFGFAATPTASLVLYKKIVARDLYALPDFKSPRLSPKNLSVGKVGTLPTASFTMSIKDDGVEIGTVTVSTAGAFTFATTGGTAKSIAAGSVVEITAPASVDATIANLLCALMLYRV